ncbi:MAG: hypothetical protein KF850_33095 [Labilithrix sp.]|nr:hypothetical protein [Labilithrix sp.]MBX3216916.1 hypothetical protein [Labilithrix sp.]
MPKQRYRVTVARQPRSSRVAGTIRGWEVRINGGEVARVRPNYEGWGNKIVGWYFAAHDRPEYGIAHRNTCGEKGVSEEDAKARAVAYVKQRLAAKVAEQSGEGEGAKR